MDIKIITIANHEVTVFRTWERYVFYHEFCGVIGIATRRYVKITDDNIFTIRAGNKSLIEGSLDRPSIIAAMKKHIAKNENKYTANKPIFEDNGENCSRCSIELNII